MDIETAFNGLIQAIIRFLPVSPFTQFADQFENLPFLGYLNWFVPIGDMLTVMMAWLLAIAAFYMYMVISRWVKLVGE